MLKVKRCFDCKMFDVANWVARLNGEDGPRERPLHETLSVASAGALDISSVVGQPPALVLLPLLLPNLYRCLKRKLGHSLKASLYKRAVVRQGKKATCKCISGPEKVQEPVSKSVSDNSAVVVYMNKQGIHSVEMCALLWKIMTWCHHYQITLRARHIPGCLNVMANLLSQSNQVQSTECSLHPHVFKQICHKWFTPHVDLFA